MNKVIINSDITNVFAGPDAEKFKNDLRVKTAEVLQFCNIPHHLKGYGQLMTGIMLAYQNPSLLDKVTAGLYPAIANICGGNATAASVERSIRHAIEWACDHTSPETGIYLIFGDVILDSGKPTNGQFLAAMSGYMRIYYPNLVWDGFDEIAKKIE